MVQDRDLNEYNPSLSRTSKQLSCSHQLCKSSNNCKGQEEPCPYIVQYKSENTASSGYLIEDVLHLTSAVKNTPPSSVQASVIFGCVFIWMACLSILGVCNLICMDHESMILFLVTST